MRSKDERNIIFQIEKENLKFGVKSIWGDFKIDVKTFVEDFELRRDLS